MIRKMLPEDYEVVYKLWISCKGIGLNNLDDSKDGVTRFLTRNPDTCLVEDVDGKIRGVLMSGNDGRRAYIYHTAVSPEYQNQGIGSKLVQAVLEVYRRIGINKVALVAFERNQLGNQFWEKQGFIVRDDLVYRNKALADIKRMDT